MSSVFDPDSFLDSEVKGSNATRFEPVPINDEGYVAVISSDDNALRARNPKEGVNVLELMWEIDQSQYPELEKLNRKHVRVRQSIFLDINPDGSLAGGENQNVQLGRLREALGQNDPRKPWSPRMLLGAGPARIFIKHRHNEETGDVYDEVAKVVKT